jgi:hypothetical protein
LFEPLDEPENTIHNVIREDVDDHCEDKLCSHILIPIDCELFILASENREILRKANVSVKVHDEDEYSCVEEGHEEEEEGCGLDLFSLIVSSFIHYNESKEELEDDVDYLNSNDKCP